MTRRAAAHDYSRPGTYHITLHVAEGRGCPLGAVVGDPLATDGSPEAPRVELSPAGQMVEQEILDEAAHHGLPVVILRDNGFPDRYHPSAAQLDRCAAGRLLLVSPWRYEYRPKGEALTVAECKTLNCVTQALCRQDDSWWKAPTIQK